MEINGHSALVTGASRGLGKCLVEELLARRGRRVYAAAPDIASLEAPSPLAGSASSRWPLT